MTPIAILMMVVTVLIIWGGLIASIVALATMKPSEGDGDDELSLASSAS